MDHAEARRTKQEVSAYVHDLLEQKVETRALTTAPPAISLGLAPQPDGGFSVAVRYRLGVPTARMVARRVAQQVGPGVDVRRTGRIRAVAPGHGGTAPRPPVVSALAVGETGRARPLRPGVSIAHVDVSAGTLGAFVHVDGVLHALSNYHVLVGSPTASIGDAVLQPGPADGGWDPDDRVGSLAGLVALERGQRALVDAAVARLDQPEVDLDYPVGRVTRTAEVTDAVEVEKIGRTTGITRGRVTAIELDDVVVGYGEELGELAFDDQIEVEGLGRAPFSRGGDSGSLVYRAADGAAVGLLFAGSETGGENGTGLTYLNPIGPVLALLGAQLAI
ncbi:S1 family peptidase [Actinotalea sp. K2]|uniref:S1 family peptidase n=1 Tax=Actinotalea sp. K2 TaxID=2939438 RepID=UPI002017C05A|nr:S1 family peptidase [Actinotalea sp. K2]MCL3861675.1 S1 family peptidase [Actinotalea sp. K2]